MPEDKAMVKRASEVDRESIVFLFVFLSWQQNFNLESLLNT